MLLATLACAPEPVTGRGYRLVYAEDFDGPGLSPQWASVAYGGSLEPTIADSVMTLRSTAANNHHWGYVASIGPRIESEPNYPFMLAWEEGYFEARLRYTDNAWSWPAFWMYSAATTEAWPGENCDFLTAEWDIMENGVANWNGERPAAHSFVSVIHRNTRNNYGDDYCGVPDETRLTIRGFEDTDLSAWHTWAGRWEDGELCTFLDGVEIDCVEAYDTTAQPMHLVFTIQYLRECPGCGARPSSLAIQVDWVRVWQR